MPRIIISHNKDAGQRYRPFDRDRRDIKKVIEEVWSKQIKGHLDDRQLTLSCECKYPSEIPADRPLTADELKRYHGCLVDLDSYDEGKSYLLDEVNFLNSLKGKVFPGGISKKKVITGLTSYINEYWFSKPIKNDKDMRDYLERLTAIVIGSMYGPEYTEGLFQIFDKSSDAIGRHRR